MNVLAYCCKSFGIATRRAAGVDPLTCPPLYATAFDANVLAARDLLYFDLHGSPGDTAWYGDDRLCAVTAEQLRYAPIRDSVVFATNCHLGDADSPMLDALLDAGVKYVIGGPGKNYAGQVGVLYASLLGQALRIMMSIGFDPLYALALAKRVVSVTRLQALLEHDGESRRAHIAAVLDTLEFKAFERRPSP